MAITSFNWRNLTVTGLGLVAGVALFHRDWITLLTHQPFYTNGYYDIYWDAYLLTYPVAFLLLFAFGGQAVRFWVVLVLPSLVVRHAQFLWEVGPTNTWPPVLAVDIALTLPVLLTCWGAVWLRSVAVRKLRPAG